MKALLPEDRRLNRYGIAWLSWVIAFATIESLALGGDRTKKDMATLCSYLRWVFGITDPQKPVRKTVGIAAWVWVLLHLFHKPSAKI